MDTLKCVHCDGSGKEWASMSLDTGQVQYRTCGVCKGTGKVSAERSHFTEYPDRSLEIAHELMRQYGRPVEICIAGNHDIRVLFKDGSRYILGGFTVGYRGTGPDYTKAFLDAAGFDISIDSIADMRPPVTLLAGQPYIPVETLVFEAPTIESAKKTATDSVPSNAKVIGLEVIRDGSPQTKEAEGISKEAAVENARRLIPKGAEADQEIVVREGKQGTQSARAYSEQDARESAQKQLLDGAEIKKIICTEPVSKGFLGFGRKPGTYEASWVLAWRVAYKYREAAAVRVSFQPPAKWEAKNIHISQFASKLRCKHCGKTHGTKEWPVSGDHVGFYFQNEPGNYTLKVTCPHCEKDWYVVWDDNPGPVKPLLLAL